MTHALDQSILELLNASHDDEDILRLQVRDRAFGFHAQQAVEKLLKALIGGHEVRYEYTHDLRALIERLTLLYEELPGDTILLVSLIDYAGIWRYQEPQPVSLAHREEVKSAIEGLRTFTLKRLSVLRSSVDWTAAASSQETLD